MPRRTMISGLLLAGLLAAGCGDDDGGGGDLGSIRASLDGLPRVDEEEMTVTYGDVSRVADLRDLERPDPDEAGSDTATDFLQTVTGVNIAEDGTPEVSTWLPEAAAPQSFGQIDEFTDEMGWNALSIDRFAELSAPPARITVMEGSFDDDRLDEALGNAEDGVWIAGDPGAEAFETDPGNRTPARPLGETLWLSLDGSRLTLSKSAEALETARSGDERLGDDPIFAALAEALDAHDTHTALLTLAGHTVLPQLEPGAEICEAAAESALAEAPTGVATGQAADGDEQLVVLALTHTDAGAAESNADAVDTIVNEGVSLASMANHRHWSDIVTLEDVEVVDDTTVVATLGATEDTAPDLWHQLIVNRDGLTGPAC